MGDTSASGRQSGLPVHTYKADFSGDASEVFRRGPQASDSSGRRFDWICSTGFAGQQAGQQHPNGLPNDL